MTTNNSNTPSGWTWTTLGDITDPNVKQETPSGDFVYIEISSIHNETKAIKYPSYLQANQAPTRAKQHLQTGDVLVSMTRPNLNAVALVGKQFDSAIGSTGFCVLRPVGVNPRWLYYVTQSPEFVGKMTSLVQGVVYPAVRPKDIRSFRVPAPPIHAQERIADEIEKQLTRLGAATALLKRIQANLRRYLTSALKEACEGRLVPTEAKLARAQKREYETAAQLLKRHSAPRGATKNRKHNEVIGELHEPPPGWTWTTVEVLAKVGQNSICAGPFGTIFKARDFRPEGIPIIFLRHVKPGLYSTARPTYMDRRKWHELFQPYSVVGGELLITKLGDPPGACATYPHGCGPAMLTPDVIKMEVNERLASATYLMHYFNSTLAKSFTSGAAFGTTRLRLTLPLFRNLPVPLPPRPEQDRIVAEVEKRQSLVSAVESSMVNSQMRAQRLRDRILQSAFHGELAPQDPNDESASVLLEKIKRTSQAAGARPRRRGRG